MSKLLQFHMKNKIDTKPLDFKTTLWKKPLKGFLNLKFASL